MNPLPNHGTKILGSLITVLGVLAANDQILSLTGKWGPSIALILSGILTALRGIQNSANATAQAASAPATTKSTVIKSIVFWTVIPFVMIAAALGGCASTGTPTTTQTFNQLILAAGTVDDTVVKTIDSLVVSRAISSAQATAALSITDKIQAAVTVANTAYTAGDQTTATAKLSAAASAITQLQSCLAAPPTNLLTCLQGVNVP